MSRRGSIGPRANDSGWHSGFAQIIPPRDAGRQAMERILVKHADWLISMDAERRIFTDGAVAIEGDRIVAAGKTRDVARNFTATKEIDATGKLVMPGLIDTHVHNVQQLGRGVAEGCEMKVHLLERLYGYESALMAEDAYCAALCCQLELIRAGTTCFIDPGSFFPRETAQAVGESGIRGIVARTAIDVHNTPIGELPAGMFRESGEEALRRAQETVTQLNGAHDGRVRAWFSLRVLSACSDTMIQAIKKKADENGVGLVMHASESFHEISASRALHGASDIERMERLGALGSNMVLIHMGWASPKELVLSMRHDLKISCTPSTGFRLGMGSMQFGRFPEMVELGITVALGSDAATSSNYLDIVRQMWLVSGACKAQRLDPTLMPPETVLEMATLNGAKAALWADEIGSLEPGKKADIAVFETRSPEWRPLLNPLTNLVHSARGGADTVLCNGRILMENGVVRTIDEREVLKQAQERGERIAERAGLLDRVRPKWPIH
jgi:5-methylthioadenosine/S-adenosylhomocysteine deaminase